MIEQVLAEIRAAEEKAALIIEEANAKAKEIAQNSAAECDALRAEINAEIKLAVKEILAEAEKEAELEAAEAQKNVRGAGEWIAENIIKGKI